MQLTPEQEAERAVNAAAKAHRRALTAVRDELAATGQRRAAARAAARRLEEDTALALVRASRLGVTYDDMATLANVSRSRVVQLLAKARATGSDTGPAVDGVELEPAGPAIDPDDTSTVPPAGAL